MDNIEEWVALCQQAQNLKEEEDDDPFLTQIGIVSHSVHHNRAINRMIGPLFYRSQYAAFRRLESMIVEDV